MKQMIKYIMALLFAAAVTSPVIAGYNPKWIKVGIEPKLVAKGSGDSFTATATFDEEDGIFENVHFLLAGESAEIAATPSGTEWKVDISNEPASWYALSAYIGDAELETPLDDRMVAVVEIEKMEITTNGSQHDVSGQSINLLKGTKYKFKAIPSPSNAPWPAGYPYWKGLADDVGVDEVELTFSSDGGFWMEAYCGYSIKKTVDITVVAPTVDVVNFTGEDITDRTEQWAPDLATPVNDPGCFVQGQATSVGLVLKCAAGNLTYPTEVTLFGDVNWFDDDVTGGNYQETTAIVQNWPTAALPLTSARNAEAEVDFDTDVDIEWRYKVAWGNDSWYDMRDSDDLTYFLIWNNHIGVQFNYDLVKWAVEKADGESEVDDIANEIFNGVYADYNYYQAGNCAWMASYGVKGCKALGVDARCVVLNAEPAAIGQVAKMKPHNFDGAGTDPTHTLPPNEWGPWGYHQWAQVNGKVYDPSSGNTSSSNEAYEKSCINWYHPAILVGGSLVEDVTVQNANAAGLDLGLKFYLNANEKNWIHPSTQGPGLGNW